MARSAHAKIRQMTTANEKHEEVKNEKGILSNMQSKAA